jgi:hypothetical protein
MVTACLAWASIAGATTVVRESHKVQQLALDSYYGWNRNYTPPVSTSRSLAKHSYEVATVSGTFSYYSAINYYHPQWPWTVVCGTPAPSAQHPGSLGGDGPVGFDAEFLFSRPWRTKLCANAHLPAHWTNFQMNDGSGWAHPELLGTAPTGPVSNHTYSYAVSGHNDPIKFRLWDILTRDNYGLLKISLRPANTADCASYLAFGFASEKRCITHMQ